MANMKRLEKRLANMEQWAKELERGSGPAQTMENMNWLVGQTRMLGDRLQQAEQAVGEMQGAIQQNNEILQKFLDKHDMIRDWQVYLEELQKRSRGRKRCRSRARSRELGCTRTSRRWRRSGRRRRLRAPSFPAK